MSEFVELDSVDWRILEELQNDASIPNKELAARVGLAPSTCLDRVRRLRENGVITAYRAEIDPRVVGLGLEAIVAVNVRPHSREVVDPFRTFVLSLPETRALFHVSGQADFLIHIAVEDSRHLQRFLVDKVSSRPEVRNLTSSIVLERVRTSALTIPSARQNTPRRRRTTR
ncbi:DNA-binding transcriptional regulator, Lrp family [Streptoalloteichus tenebrarius]|uniref:DNA-binding transcriptional regulator, Lrp family n=1 Tax=Streptoalloteichus tenebrarius (strain ATCC 17920 / DSM 40477 / JCM 4838 / CBS 697.72 / NBRC 16177 / NCIMB 11028 / NRRL B-12390 / A12253. 1 / ISP 5477) TaxID=1933 RepID=A0ABT1HME4_STRSD|nr:Lrp/AsnC family transcriptional regulator [Streptoalloteichus tenebrarius]MCP2256683.1 DNA-binding transcriptional regulator, Lrp family [Streptoalloteichus tenebrarius]